MFISASEQHTLLPVFKDEAATACTSGSGQLLLMRGERADIRLYRTAATRKGSKDERGGMKERSVGGDGNRRRTRLCVCENRDGGNGSNGLTDEKAELKLSFEGEHGPNTAARLRD